MVSIFLGHSVYVCMYLKQSQGWKSNIIFAPYRSFCFISWIEWSLSVVIGNEKIGDLNSVAISQTADDLLVPQFTHDSVVPIAKHERLSGPVFMFMYMIDLPTLIYRWSKKHAIFCITLCFCITKCDRLIINDKQGTFLEQHENIKKVRVHMD